MPPLTFTPRASIQRVKRPSERINALSGTPPRVIRSPSPALIRSTQQAKKSGPTPCKSCGSTETEEGDGNIVCKGCGLVLSNAPNYTSDITFEEGSNGRIQQQGQRIADGQTHQKAFAPRGLGGGPGHEATPAGDKAKTEATNVVRRFAMLLRIDEREVNMGRRIFEMAYNRGFVRGRTIESVAIVSLYIATRRAKDRKPLYDIMLIDLAEQANINVFDLGKMMQDLIKNLYLNPDGSMSKEDHFYLQAHGAEVLIDKFVNHLDFGDDSNKIKNDATRILQRMKRDWLHHGRRPSGVCGAAVILAARMNNYRRTLREVVLVAKVTEFTVSKRLEEFKETKSSGLSVNDFRDDDILSSIQDTDPPAYYQALQGPKRKGKRGRPRRKQLPVSAAEIEEADSTNELDRNNDAEGQPPAKRARIDADGFAIPAVPVRATPTSQAAEENIDPALRDPVSDPVSARRSPGRAKGSKNWRAPPPTAAELAYEAELTESMQEALDSNQDLDPGDVLLTPPATQASSTRLTGSSDQPPPRRTRAQTRPQQDRNVSDAGATSLPLRVDPAECDPKKGPPGPAVNTNEGNTNTISLDPVIADTEFDSDPEVSTCLLSEAERVLKEKIWVTENADWLRQDHAKKIRRELKDRHLREMGIDPDEARRIKKGEIRKRKDGARRSGRIGDVGYLKDDFHQRHGAKPDGPGSGQVDADGEAAEGGGAADVGTAAGEHGRRPSTASMNVKAMMKQRGTYSRRINYDNLVKAYEYPTGSSSSPSISRSRSRSPSHDRDPVSYRASSIVSISSNGSISDADAAGITTTTAAAAAAAAEPPSTTQRTNQSSIGPIFRHTTRTRRPRANSKSRPGRNMPAEARSQAGVRSRVSTMSRSPSPIQENINRDASSTTPDDEGVVPTADLQQRQSKRQNARQEEDDDNDNDDDDERVEEGNNDNEDEVEVEVLGASTSASPLSSTHTPGSNGAPKIDRSMYADVDAVAAVTPPINTSTYPHDDDDDDDEDDDEEDEEDEDEDLDDAFAGNFKERPIWEGEGEDEIVEE